MQPVIATPEAVETWKNAAASTVVIKKHNQQGILDEIVLPGGRTVSLTPHERRINQENAADASLDVFTNGMLAPVRLLDNEADTEELKANVNAMSETAMKALFKSQIKTFTSKVNEISNPITLRRLLEVAAEVDGSIRQESVIKDRLEAVGPGVTDVTGASTRAFSSGMNPVAPR